MKKSITHISSLTRKDIASILTADDIEVGDGIAVEKTERGVKVSIDTRALGVLIWRYVKGNAITAVNNVTAVQAASVIDSNAS